MIMYALEFFQNPNYDIITSLLHHRNFDQKYIYWNGV